MSSDLVFAHCGFGFRTRATKKGFVGMTDIVEWLRAYANRTTVIDIKRLDEAAAEIERLRAALELIDSVSVHSGGDIHGVHPSQWEAAFKEVQAMTRSALEEGRT